MTKQILSTIAALTVISSMTGTPITASAQSLGIDVDTLSEESIIYQYSNDSGRIIKRYDVLATADDDVWHINESVECVFSDESDYFYRDIPSDNVDVNTIEVTNRNFEVSEEDGITSIIIERNMADEEIDRDGRGRTELFNISYNSKTKNESVPIIDNTWDCNILHTDFRIFLNENDKSPEFTNEKAHFTYFEDESAVKGRITDLIEPTEAVTLNYKTQTIETPKDDIKKESPKTEKEKKSIKTPIIFAVCTFILVGAFGYFINKRK